MQWLRCISREQMIGYSLAVLSTAVAAWGRSSLTPVLGDRVPFGFFFTAVLFTAWLAGSGPAIVSLLLGTLAAAHFVILPESSLWIDDRADQLALLIYVLGGGVSIFLFHRLGRQQQLAEQRAEENERLSLGLQQADRRKDEFLALLAHELRNPLTPLCTGLELLDRGSASRQTQSDTVRMMLRQLKQVMRLLDDLLDVSRFMKGALRLRRELMDLRQAVQVAIESTRPLMDAQAHDFRCFLPAHPVWVDGDHVRLVQTVANLLTNAAKYTPRNGRIRLHLDCCDGLATLELVDNGIGVSPADQERIFELFTQVDESRCREYQGLGIGLGLVRQLVQAHGGEIGMTSPGAGRGSRFCITMPVAQAPANAPPAVAATPAGLVDPLPEQPAAPDDEAVGPLRVLIVDDNRDSADTLGTLLRFDGMATEIAYEGGAALAMVAQFDPHVVLLDIGLPGMDGFEVARRIRAMPGGQRRRIVALSGWGPETLGSRITEAGFDSHWLKPVDVDALLHDLTQPSSI